MEVSRVVSLVMPRRLGSVPDGLASGLRRNCGKLDASPTARALLTLEMVQSSPGITAERLAEKLGISERAARRYVGILREAGIHDRVGPRALRRLPRSVAACGCRR